MAFITVPSINVGDEITVDTFNTFITEVNNVQGNLNDENIQNEGIDRRNINTDAIQKLNTSSKYLYRSSDDHVIPGPATIFQTITQIDLTGAGSGHPIMVGRPTTIDLDNSEFLLVNCSFSFRVMEPLIPSASSAGNGGYQVEFRLVYDDTVAGIALAEVSGTQRKFTHFMSMHNGFHADTRYSCTIVAAIQATSTSTGKNKMAVSLQGKNIMSNNTSTSGIAVVEEVQMFARVIRR